MFISVCFPLHDIFLSFLFFPSSSPLSSFPFLFSSFHSLFASFFFPQSASIPQFNLPFPKSVTPLLHFRLPWVIFALWKMYACNNFWTLLVLCIIIKGRLQNPTAGWPAVPSGSGRLSLFRTIETGRNRTEPPVNRPLGFEAVPKLDSY